MPRWLNRSKQQQLLRLFKGARAEMDGLLAEDNREQAFDPDAITRVFTQPRHMARNAPEFVVIGIDPSGGGLVSNFCLVTLYQDANTSEIVVSVCVCVCVNLLFTLFFFMENIEDQPSILCRFCSFCPLSS